MKRRKITPAVLHDLEQPQMVHGDGTRRLELFEDELLQVVGGRVDTSPIDPKPEPGPIYTPTFSFAGAQSLAEDDCES